MCACACVASVAVNKIKWLQVQLVAAQCGKPCEDCPKCKEELQEVHMISKVLEDNPLEGQLEGAGRADSQRGQSEGVITACSAA